MYDEDIEKAMLYYLIFEKENYILTESDFVFEYNKKIIKAINELKANKHEITTLSVRDKINGDKKQILEYLAYLGEYIRVISSEEAYNRIIEMSKKRQIIDLLQNSIQNVNEINNIDNYAQKTIKKLNEICSRNEKEKTFLEQVVDTINVIENANRKKADYSLYTGIIDLDKLICGLHKQELTIIGARPRNRQNNIRITNS